MSYMKHYFEEHIDEMSDQDLFDFGCETQEEVDELREALSGKKEEYIDFDPNKIDLNEWKAREKEYLDALNEIIRLQGGNLYLTPSIMRDPVSYLSKMKLES